MPQEQLPRIDPENRLGLDFHAPRALRQFESITNLGERRAAVLHASFRNQGAHDGEADAMRERLLETLDLIEGKSEPQGVELTPEQIWFEKFKTRFDALPQLHKGVQWADVAKSLTADPESMRKLQALDEKGHNMNVFGEENGEFIFASGWNNYNEVSLDHRNIAYDLEGQKLAKKYGRMPTGNAVEIAKLMGVNLAGTKFDEQLRKAVAVNGWAYLETDDATRETGVAFRGDSSGVRKNGAGDHDDFGSFRAALRVKKA